MKSATEYLWFDTKHHREFINITDKVEQLVRKSGIKEGFVLVSAKPSFPQELVTLFGQFAPGYHAKPFRFLPALFVLCGIGSISGNPEIEVGWI